MRILLTISVCLFFSGLASCKGEETPTASRRPIQVVTANYPLAFFAKRIGGKHVEVEMPVPAGVNPAVWQPTPEDIGRIQQADAILLNGAGYASWAKSASLPSSRTWRTSNNKRDRWIQVESGEVHSHGPGGEHSHMKTVSTTWLDPDIAIAQANSVLNVLKRLAPEYQNEFTSQFRVLRRQIIEASADIEQAINTHPNRAVFFAIPGYEYLQRRYRINGQSVDWTPDSMPSESEWVEFQSRLEDHPATWMIWDSQPDPAIEERLQTLGVSSVVYPTCANTPESGDFLDAISESAASLRKVYDAEDPR